MDIREIQFRREKYGPELLVDVGWVEDLEGFILGDEPHRLNFYDILLVTSGTGRMELDDGVEPIEPGRCVFTSPGQVRRLEAENLDGVVLFFLGEFVDDFFNDPLFLHRLRFFHSHRSLGSLAISTERCAWLVERLETMRRELDDLRRDSAHLMRAVMYEVLVTINRWYSEATGVATDALAGPLVLRFLRLLDDRPCDGWRLQDYARELGVGAGHLSAASRRSVGVSAGALIRARVVAEAKRRLIYSDRPAYAIGHELGFDDPAYFGRFLKRETGCTPRQFRCRHRGRIQSPVLA